MSQGKSISGKDLANLKEQLERMPRDKDRLRLITAAAEGHTFTCVASFLFCFLFPASSDQLPPPPNMDMLCRSK